MTEVVKNLWVGNSEAEKWIDRHGVSITGVLVTAHDMAPVNDWRRGIEYMHVGLMDGPGNLLSAYHSAVLALSTLVKKHKDNPVLVCCHNGSRSLAVVVMYLYLIGAAPSWDECMERLRIRPDLPKVHGIHRSAFFLMDWGMMTRVLDGEVSE